MVSLVRAGAAFMTSIKIYSADAGHMGRIPG